MAALWSSLEVNIGIISSCLPTLKAVVTRVFPRFFTSAYGVSVSNRTPGLTPIPSSNNKNAGHAFSAERKMTLGRDPHGTLELKSLATMDVEETISLEEALGDGNRSGSQAVREKEALNAGDRSGIQVTKLVEQSSWTAERKHSDPSVMESAHQQSKAPSVNEIY